MLFDEEHLGVSSLLSGTRIFSPCRTSKYASSLNSNSHVIMTSICVRISWFSLIS